MKKMETPQMTNWKAEMTASAWATPHTAFRQKSSLLRKTAIAMNPANQKMTLVNSNARALYGWDASRSRQHFSFQAHQRRSSRTIVLTSGSESGHNLQDGQGD